MVYQQAAIHMEKVENWDPSPFHTLFLPKWRNDGENVSFAAAFIIYHLIFHETVTIEGIWVNFATLPEGIFFILRLVRVLSSLCRNQIANGCEFSPPQSFVLCCHCEDVRSSITLNTSITLFLQENKKKMNFFAMIDKLNSLFSGGLWRIGISREI